MEYDYIIVGSGAAGSVLADRLSRENGLTVLVIEAGGSDRNPVHYVPKGFFFTMQAAKYTKRFTTIPYGPEGSTDQWFRGRVVGGSTTLNGLIWNRGWAPDYDRLEADGNPGWGWDTFLDAFKNIETARFGDHAIHGTRGPVDVEIGGPAEPISEAFIESAQLQGMKRVADVNGSDESRVGYTQFSTKRGTRVSAARSFLRPALKRSNLTLAIKTEVSTLLFDGTRVIGVRARRDGKQVEFRARKEVIVCGGTLETPQLLERSGIGSEHALRTAGITPLVDSPNVGERMSEHRGLRFMYRVSGAAGYNAQVNSTVRQMMTGAKYLVQRGGIISQGSANVLSYLTVDPSSDRPDAIGFFNPISITSGNLHSNKLQVDGEPGMMVALYPLRPTSQGSIHISGPTPDDPAIVDAQYLTTDHDKKVIIGMGRAAREVFASGPISRLITDELSPGRAITTDDELVHNALTAGASGYHTLGTCAMGPNDDDVVDGRLRVRGVEGLRVVDASVFPYQPSGNTSAPTQALAWHAAKLILEDR